MPCLILVAGPNGSGKTTLVRSGILAELTAPDLLAINADDIARDLAGGILPSPEQSLRAAQIGDDSLDAALAGGRSVLMETVLSSDKLQRRVTAALGAGYEIVLVYITLRSGALNVARVLQRHAQGGHTIPTDRILERRERSHALFGWFARAATQVLVFDNTDAGQPVCLASKHGGVWSVADASRLPDAIAAAIQEMMG